MRRPRWKPVRERDPIAVALVGFVVLAVIGITAFNAPNLPVIGGGTTYAADFTEAAGLRPGDEVRVAGVKVGTVGSVALAHAQVRVRFRVRHTWVGNASTVAIEIRTVLGDKYLAIDPLGDAAQNPRQTIPAGRTSSPYDVTQAFEDLSSTVGELDTDKLATSLEAISQTFRDTPGSVHEALTGLSALSKTIGSRDAQLKQLLAATSKITGTVAAQDRNFAALLRDGNTLLAEVQARRDAIQGLLTGTEALSTQLTGLIDEDGKQLGPTLKALGDVTGLLQRNSADLTRALSLAGPYTRLLGNTLGNGRWMDAYLCGLVPAADLTSPATGCAPSARGGK